MSAAPLVFTTREDAASLARPAPTIDSLATENVHYGSIAIVGVDGGVTHFVGDPHGSTFTRSTLKPFQALPFVRASGPSRFGWTSREVALMCASHSGEPMHTEIVRSMLDAADCGEAQLQCGCHVSGHYAALGRTAPAGATWTPVEHNCSGKHAGFLASCRLHDEPVDDYLDPASPLQRRIAAAVSGTTGLSARELGTGTDGCSAPNFAMPLSRLALLYARLAQGRDAPHDGDAFGTLFDAMTRHPELVSGTARSDLSLMTLGAGNWVTKIGADGVQAIGVRSAGLGIAIKVADGDRNALYRVVVEVLAQLGLANADGLEGLRSSAWHHTMLHNGRGIATGRVVPAFKLQPA